MLTLNEAALLLNISPLNLRRWTLCGKMPANKIGKKWAYKRIDIYATKNLILYRDRCNCDTKSQVLQAFETTFINLHISTNDLLKIMNPRDNLELD